MSLSHCSTDSPLGMCIVPQMDPEYSHEYSLHCCPSNFLGLKKEWNNKNVQEMSMLFNTLSVLLLFHYYLYPDIQYILHAFYYAYIKCDIVVLDTIRISVSTMLSCLLHITQASGTLYN